MNPERVDLKFRKCDCNVTDLEKEVKQLNRENETLKCALETLKENVINRTYTLKHILSVLKNNDYELFSNVLNDLSREELIELALI